jgi:hypothetical protein
MGNNAEISDVLGHNRLKYNLFYTGTKKPGEYRNQAGFMAITAALMEG